MSIFYYCSQVTNKYLPQNDELTCDTSIIILLVNISILIMITFYSYKNKRSSIFSSKVSIFSYLGPQHPYMITFLYMIVGFSFIIIRPAAYILSDISYYIYGTDKYDQNLLIALGQSIFGSLSYFSLLVMIFFFGAKSELLSRIGKYSVEEDERGTFLRNILVRSFIFASIYIICCVLTNFLQSTFILDSNSIYSNSLGFSINRVLRSSTLLVLSMYRFKMLKYAEHLQDVEIIKWEETEKKALICKHLEDYVRTSTDVKDLIRMECNHSIYDDYKIAISEMLEDLIYSVNSSLKVLKSKYNVILDNRNKSSPLLKNTREESLIFDFWFIFSLFDFFMTLVFNLILTIILLINKTDVDDDNDNDLLLWNKVITYINLVLFIMENTIQGTLILMIIRNKANYGERINIEMICGPSILSSVRYGDVSHNLMIIPKKSRPIVEYDNDDNDDKIYDGLELKSKKLYLVSYSDENVI